MKNELIYASLFLLGISGHYFIKTSNPIIEIATSTLVIVLLATSLFYFFKNKSFFTYKPVFYLSCLVATFLIISRFYLIVAKYII